LLDEVTVVIPNFKMPGLLKGLVDRLLKLYPDIRLLLIDNGSRDSSTAYISSMADSFYNIKVILNQVNAGHGPAMHQGMGLCETRLVCLMDSDCIVRRPGGLELLAEPFSDKSVYATGEMVLVDAGGNTKDEGEPYILPSRMMILCERYFGLEPFNHHGAPAVLNIRSADARGFRLVNLPDIDDYIHHPGQGLEKGPVHLTYGIPGWHHRKFYLPESAPSAAERLQKANPVVLGSWR